MFQQVRELLAAGIVEPSDSAWSCPVVIPPDTIEMGGKTTDRLRSTWTRAIPVHTYAIWFIFC